MVSLYSADNWKKRLRNLVDGDPAKTVFVVGAGLSWDGKVGVWGVSEILEHVKATYNIEPSAQPSSAAYQEVLGKLKAQEGSKGVEKTIRLAVLASDRESQARQKATKEVESNERLSACRALQADAQAWHLPAGVLALADLIAVIEARVKSNPNWKHPCVLSTNFDGLLEAALKQKQVEHKTDAIAGNEFPRGIDEQVSILHLHGYWLREPTLHDPAALGARRDSLKAALQGLLNGAQVFVLGYGGWNDIIFDTAAKVLEHQQSDSLPEVMWAFHESENKVRADDENAKSPCGHVIANFSNSIALARTTFYCGIDVHRDLREVVTSLGTGAAPPEPAAGADGVTGTPELVQLVKALLPTVPKRLRVDFQALLADAEGSNPVGLVGVVALCCRALEEGGMDADGRTGLTEAAWDLITFMVRVLVNPIRARANLSGKARPGEILTVPAKTHFLVALLMAKYPDPRHLLQPSPKGAISRDDLSLAARSIPFESGPAEADRLNQFETLL